MAVRIDWTRMSTYVYRAALHTVVLLLTPSSRIRSGEICRTAEVDTELNGMYAMWQKLAKDRKWTAKERKYLEKEGKDPDKMQTGEGDDVLTKEEFIKSFQKKVSKGEHSRCRSALGAALGDSGVCKLRGATALPIPESQMRPCPPVAAFAQQVTVKVNGKKEKVVVRNVERLFEITQQGKKDDRVSIQECAQPETIDDLGRRALAGFAHPTPRLFPTYISRRLPAPRFIDLMLMIRSKDPDKKLALSFAMCDTNRSGSLDKNEVHNMLMTLVTAEDVSASRAPLSAFEGKVRRYTVPSCLHY